MEFLNRKKPQLVVLLVALVALIFFALSFRPRLQDSPLVPIIGNENPSYSLDAEVVGLADIGQVYLLEYRGSPNYRIVRYDSASGDLSEVFNVPAGGLVYGIALSPSRDKLAIGYTEDFSIDGNGIYLLDLDDEDKKLVKLVTESENTYFFDLEWTQDDSLWATRTDSAMGSNSLSRIDTASGTVTEIVTEAIDPTVVGEMVAYFPLEADDSRRSVSIYNTTDGTSEAVDVFDKGYDLDNLIYDPGNDEFLVSALNRSGGLTLRFGESVYAHGNHSIPSSWAVLSGDSYSSVVDGQLESKLVYDAAVTGNSDLLEVTNEGLYAGDVNGERELLIKSRALRFIAY